MSDLLDLRDRLFRAYFRRFGKDADSPSQFIEYFDENGLSYARLSNVRGVLAVYRIKEDGSLKYMKRKNLNATQ